MFKNIKITLYIGLIFLLGVNYLNYAQSIEKRIENLDKVDYSAINDSIGNILWDIYLKPPAIAKKYAEQMLIKTKKISTEIYLNAKLFSLNYDKTNYLSKLDSIYCEAKKTNLVSRMKGVLLAKSTYYKENERYDSSMVAVLEALNIHQGTENDDFTVACLQVIGDLYYTAGLYDDAESIFLRINELKGSLSQWNNWRKRVIRNNLALIDVKRGNYKKAIDKFNISLNEVKLGNLGVVDSIAAIYLFNKLAETYYLFNNFEKALQYYQIGIIQAINHKQDEYIANLYFIKSNICFDRVDYDSALIYAKKSEAVIGNEYNSLYFNSKLSGHISNIYKKLNNLSSAFNYSEKTRAQNDSLLQKKNKWSYLQILSKSNSDKLNMQLAFTKDINNILLVGGIVLVFFLSLIVILNFRLRRSNLKLVSKNLELENRKSGGKVKQFGESELSSRNINEDNNKELIKKLDDLMNNNNLYFQKDITIQNIAEMLNTNRTYLSNAINQVLDINFSCYINKLRMQEVIRLIQEGFFKNHKIEGIAYYSGFRSRTAFNKAFIDYTGVTPSYFLKNLETALNQVKSKENKD